MWVLYWAGRMVAVRGSCWVARLAVSTVYSMVASMGAWWVARMVGVKVNW